MLESDLSLSGEGDGLLLSILNISLSSHGLKLRDVDVVHLILDAIEELDIEDEVGVLWNTWFHDIAVGH